MVQVGISFESSSFWLVGCIVRSNFQLIPKNEDQFICSAGAPSALASTPPTDNSSLRGIDPLKFVLENGSPIADFKVSASTFF
jgi:hypothetical protein